MKRILFFLFLFAGFTSLLNAQTKRALIIAIGNYPEPEKNGWPELSSLHDVPLVKTALEKQDFKSENIVTLLDTEATKSGIEKALDKLIAVSNPGDIVVIHISSHGQQLEDDNINEESDGLDETIVPYGAVYSPDRSLFSRYSAGYFRDDAFGEKITKLRNKLKSKGDVLVTLDACHSGTGTRGPITAKARGSNSPMVSPNFDKKKAAPKDVTGVFKDNNNTALDKDAATYVLISGAQAKERNYECLDDEGNTAGSLSYAFSKTLTTLDGKTTYRALFSLIEDVMREKAPNQKPVLEGDGIDRELFGGEYKEQQPYLLIDARNSNADTIFLNTGTVAGVTKGSIIGFYPPTTTNPNGLDPIQKGTVVVATNFSAAVKLDKPNEDFLKRTPRAFLLEMSYGGQPIRLGLDSVENSVRKGVKDALKDYSQALIVPNCEIYFARSDAGAGYDLRYANTGVLFEQNVDITNPAELMTVLKRYDRYRYLRDLKFLEKGLSARVELVFLNSQRKIDVAKMKSRTKNGRFELHVNDTVYLKIVNTGAKKMFYNIVDVQPNGIINRVAPNRTLKDVKNLPRPLLPESCTLNAKDSTINTDMMIIIGEPYGEEMFKVFLSTNMLDLEDILAGNSDMNSRHRGILNNLAKVFEASENKTGSRGVNPTVNTAQDGTIFSYNFWIVEE